MKRSTRRSISAALFAVLVCSSMLALAAGPRTNPVVTNDVARVSDRLIVKFKANSLPRGLSVAQIRAQLMQPLTAQALSQLQTAAGVALTERRAIFNGAHVLGIAGRPDRQTMNNALAGIRRLAGIEYVEEDRILTAQAVPDDTYYTNGLPNPIPPPATFAGLWGMWPAATVASPAPGATGSYGADFETAWNSVTGTGVVVAVIDTGITPHLDIVGPGGIVAAGAGSNLVSVGYDFIQDCRTRGTCAATTPDGSATIAPSADATDLGDFITVAECTTVGSVFYGMCPVDALGNPVQENSSWHGTHVAGTIAALGNNAIGVIGGAYNARILPVRVLGKGGGNVSDIAEAILWAADVHQTIANPNKARVINMSLGAGAPCSASPTTQDAINAAVAAGTVVVVAAGNSNADVANFLPASCNNVISVASISRDGSRAGYSNYSSPSTNTTNPTNVTLAAQGGDMWDPTFDPAILSTLNSGTTTPVMTGGSSYDYYQGTSMATPHVAAAAALMLATNSTLTPAQVKTILSAPSSLTAFPSFDAGWAEWDCTIDDECGAGILNADLAVQNSSPTVSAPATRAFGSVLVNGSVSSPVTMTNTWFFPAQAGTATVTGTGAAHFGITGNTCSGASIASAGTCRITVSYAPTVTGAHTATLTVPITNASSPVLVDLTGTSVVQLTTADETAATVAVGQSTTVNVSYTNPNVTAVDVGAISLSQPAIMATSVDNCSSSTLAAGASCTATVTITPAAIGDYSGTASLALATGGTPAVATISGSATEPVAPPPSAGGGGCSIMPFGADPDMSLLLALLAVAAYWSRRRMVRGRSAD